MGITVSTPHGVSIQFPDGTDEATIRRVMTEASGGQRQPATSNLEALGRGALQGATFGLSDEIYAGARGAYDAVTGGRFGETYDRELADVRAANKRARDTNPIAYIGGEVAGGFAIPGLGAAKTAKVAADATRGARALSAAKTGTAMGAAYGFGTAEGGDGTLAEQATNRATSALPSALAGGLVGAATPSLVDAGLAIVRGLTNPLRAAVNPVGTARTKVAEALLRDAPEGSAVDGVLAQAGRRLERAREVKPDAILADVGGQNTRDLLRSAANMPSQGAQRLNNTLNRRQGFQWSRIEKDLTDTLADGNAYARTLNDVEESLKSLGSRMFGDAYAQPLTGSAKERELAQFIASRGYIRKLMEKTQQTMQGTTGEDVAKLSPWEFLHRTKMEIDKQIGKLKRGQGDPADNWDLRELTMLKREMVKRMGDANPKFREAMEKYGDLASIKTALESGAEDFAKLPWRELQQEMKGLTRIEASMYRLGAARSLFEQIERGNIMRDRTESLFSSADIQNKLAVLYPNTAARREMQKRLILEARMADTRKAVQGNSTTAKQLAQGQEAGQEAAPVVAVANLGAGRMAPALNYLSRQMQIFSGMTPAVANQVIQEMMAKGTLGTSAGLQSAVERAARQPAFRDQLVRRILSGVSAGRASDGNLDRSQQPVPQR